MRQSDYSQIEIVRGGLRGGGVALIVKYKVSFSTKAGSFLLFLLFLGSDPPATASRSVFVYYKYRSLT